MPAGLSVAVLVVTANAYNADETGLASRLKWRRCLDQGSPLICLTRRLHRSMS